MPFNPLRFALRAVPALAAALLIAGPLAAQAPANDQCSSPMVLPGSGPFPIIRIVDTRHAFDDAGDPIFCNDSGLLAPNFTTRSVWFTFTPTTTDTYRIDTKGTIVDTDASYDRIFGILTGDCGNFTLLACIDTTGASDAITVALAAGVKYTILVLGRPQIAGPPQFGKFPTDGGDLHLNIAVAPVTYLYSYAIASVAHFSGFTLFTSDLYVTNTESGIGQFNIQFLGHVNPDGSNPPASQPITTTQSLAGNGSKTFVDILSSVFGTQSDFGTLLVQSTKKLQIGAKTFSPGPFGQYTDGVEVSDSNSPNFLNQNEAGRIVGVRENDADFRTNIALFNMGGGTCTAQIAVFDTNGSIMAPGIQTFTVPAKTMIQLNQIKPSLGITSDVQDASVGIKALSAGCRLGAAGYVVSRVTQDPFTSLMKKGASLF
jgi:hypothetical protein